jgi:hypothetical protein
MFVKWSNELAKIPIDEHASAVVRIIADNHDIPYANVAMKDANLASGLVG